MSSSSSSAVSRLASQKKSTRRKGKKRNSSTKSHVSRAGWGCVSEGVIDVTMPLAATVNNRVYDVIQSTTVPGTITSSTTFQTYSAFFFKFTDVDQNASLGAVFDQYRVVMLEVTFLPRMTIESSGSANTGLFTSVIDYDDATALTHDYQAYDYENALTGRGLDPQKRTWRPHAAVAAYGGGVFTSFANEESPWIDAASGTVQHYGLKTAWTVTDAAYTIDVLTRVWLQFRNVR